MKHFIDTLMMLLTMPVPAKKEHLLDFFKITPAEPAVEESIHASLNWLLRAQANSKPHDGGFSRHYCLRNGWGPSYPETTGYIIPTLLECEKEFDRPELGAAAEEALNWLIGIQFPDGGFQGGTVLDKPVVPVIFNTGQILFGLAAGTKRFGQPYAKAMTAAADWLVQAQDEDGAWRKFPSPFADSSRLRAYDTHVAWGLIEAYKTAGNESWLKAAMRHLHHALGFKADNGFVASCCLMNPQMPYTHTLGYYLRGLVEGAAISNDKFLLDVSLDLANRLAGLIKSDGFLAGKIDHLWHPAAAWSCLTGSVQIAACFFRLAEITKDSSLIGKARLLNQYVRRTVKIIGPSDPTDGITGGIKGAYPTFGYYNRYQFLNWAAKFFVDSSLMELRLKLAGQR